ncbi:MAG: ATP-binding protein [Candidatus Glassbacteria bacterium]|nr:ATP-binding protein [Candidatus Glassbacteria bacterium]
MKECLDIRIPGHPKMMQLVRRTIGQACEMVGFSEREANSIMLAVDEGCTNIIRHCYGGCLEGDIVIRIRMFKDRIEILIRDFGDEIDVEKLRECLEARQKELEEQGPVRPGGLGVMLIHSVMDRVQYKSSNRFGTVLKLVKHLSPKGGKKVAAKH